VEQADWLTPRREDWVAALAEAGFWWGQGIST
jgi:predicted alpha/beta hydrolase family esterase